MIFVNVDDNKVIKKKVVFMYKVIMLMLRYNTSSLGKVDPEESHLFKCIN